MDDRRAGAVLRALRRRAGLRQLDVAKRAGCHQTTVSRAEIGELDSLSLAALRRIFGAVGARFDGEVRWRGGEVDRLLDAAHAQVVEAVGRSLRRWRWTVLPEVSFSEYGERGSIDLLAGFIAARAVAVIEIKTEITAVDETVRIHDVKTRLATKLAQERFGWRPAVIARVLILPDTTATRSVITTHGAIFRARYPMSSREIRRWLRSPVSVPLGTLGAGAIWFLTLKHRQVAKRTTGARQRVRTPKRIAV